MSAHSKPWPRTIVHADMDAFFAAVEQLDDPSLRGRPLLIGSDRPRAVVLTASYEARPFGVGSAMPMQRARRLCPQALVVPPRMERYQRVSKLVMKAFAGFSPHVEPLSLDEAFIDMTGSERLFGDPLSIGRRIKQTVYEVTGGLTASVGISATRYVAKVASGFNKPDALTVVPPDRVREWLAPMPVENLWGAGAKTAKRLRAMGFETIGQVAAADRGQLQIALGEIGGRFFELANGVDERVVLPSRTARSLGSERTLSRDIRAVSEIEPHLRAAADTVARRLRQKTAVARGVRIKLKRTDFRLVSRQCTMDIATDVSTVLFAWARKLLRELGDVGPVRLVGLAAFDLASRDGVRQLELGAASETKARRLETAVDAIAERFGSGIVKRAAALVSDEGVGSSLGTLDFLDVDD